MSALNMAVVSINRILTTQSRAVLEQEYHNIINNLNLASIKDDEEMMNLFQEIMRRISRKRVSDEDNRRLRSYYDSAEQKRITYALSSIRLTEAQITAQSNDIAGLEREGNAQIKAAQSSIAAIERENQARLRAQQNTINTLHACLYGAMVWDSATAKVQRGIYAMHRHNRT